MREEKPGFLEETRFLAAHKDALGIRFRGRIFFAAKLGYHNPACADGLPVEWCWALSCGEPVDRRVFWTVLSGLGDLCGKNGTHPL